MNVSAIQTTAEELNAEMRRAVMPITVIVGVEVVLAFFGNCFVLYVFLRRYPSCNFRYFVLYLTTIDVMCALTTMPGEIVTQLNWYVYPDKMLCKIKSFFNVFTVSAEALCFLLIAVDRYLKVCHPLGWQIKLRVAKWLGLAIFIPAFLISVPVAVYWGTHHEPPKGTTANTTICENDQEYKDTKKPFAYSVSVESILGIGLACIILLYALIARKVMCQHRRNREGQGEHVEGRAFSESVKSKTLIMFILTITFVVTIIIYLTLLSFIAKGTLDNMSDRNRAVYFFFFRFYFINHVINPVVYGLLDPQFRKCITCCQTQANSAPIHVPTVSGTVDLQLATNLVKTP